MAKSKKSRSRRAKAKYPAINPTLNLKTRYEEIADIASYFDSLPESAKKYMNSFVEEYVNAKFDHKGKKIYTKVKDKRAIYNRNNARNRDVLTKAKASGQYIETDDLKVRKRLVDNAGEDKLILMIDAKAELAKRGKKKRKKS